MTSLIIARIGSSCESLGPRYDAPMQKRVAPASLRAAAPRRAPRRAASGRGCRRPSSKRMLCGQYAQSSGHAPVLIDSSVETCTAFAIEVLPMHPLRRVQQIVERQLEQRRDLRLGPVAARLRRSRDAARRFFLECRHSRSLPGRLARDDGASQTLASAVNRREASWFTAPCAGWFVESCPACGGPSERRLLHRLRRRASRACATPCRRCGLAKPVARCPREQAPWHVDARARAVRLWRRRSTTTCTR